MGKIRAIAVAVLSVLSVTIAIAAPAKATVSNPQAFICGGSCLSLTTSGTAGETKPWAFRFGVPGGFNGSTDEIVIDGTGSGIQFPTNPNFENYFIVVSNSGYCVCSTVIRENNNQRVRIRPANPTMNLGPATITVEISNVVNPTLAGNRTFQISTTRDSVATSSAVSIAPTALAGLDVVSGDNDSATVGEAFAASPKVKAVDQFRNGLSGHSVTFTAPETGPSGTMAGGTSGGRIASVTTDTNGEASTPALTANTEVGSWVLAVGTASFTTSLDLTNLVGPAADVDVSIAPPSIVGDGASSAQMTADIDDQYGNPITGHAVSFDSTDQASAPGGQLIGSTTDNGDGTYTASIRSTAAAGLFTITAIDSTPAVALTDTATLEQTADLVLPVEPVIAGPSKIRGSKATFTFASSDADVASYECRLDRKSFRPCTSPTEVKKISMGKHKFAARAIDNAGNIGPEAVHTFKKV